MEDTLRLAVLADIHGNLPALEAVLADVQQQSVDGVIVAGDLTGGPQPVETIALLRSLGSWMIRGNSEDYLLAYDAGDIPNTWRISQQWATVRWSYHHLDRETLNFIASLPEQRVVELRITAPIRVVHGSPRSPSEHLFPEGDPASLRVFREAGLFAPDCEPPKLDLALAEVDVILKDSIIDVCFDNRRCLINRCRAERSSAQLRGDRLFFFALNADVAFDAIEIRPF